MWKVTGCGAVEDAGHGTEMAPCITPLVKWGRASSFRERNGPVCAAELSAKFFCSQSGCHLSQRITSLQEAAAVSITRGRAVVPIRSAVV